MSEAKQCPACGFREAVCLWEVSPERAAQHFVQRESDITRHLQLAAHIGRLWRGKAGGVWRCSRCGLRYAQPFLAGDHMFYKLAYPIKGVYPERKWDFEQTYDTMARRPAERSGAGSGERRVMEIGGGCGGFVRGLVRRGLTSPESVVCTEFDEAGLRAIRASGFKAIEADFRELTLADTGGRFEALCLFQVLEHLDDLDRVFGVFDRFLEPGGSVYLAVPHAAHIAFNEEHGALLDMPPNHITCWTVAALCRLAERHGFRVAEHTCEPFRAVADTRLFMAYRFLRRAQEVGSWPNRLSGVGMRPLLKAGGAVWALAEATRAGAELRALWRERPGRSLWARLERG